MLAERRRRIGGILSGVLFACAAPRAVRVERSTDREFDPKRSVFEVEVLRDVPSRPHLEIARISAGGGYYETVDAVLARVREHASLLGADALIVTRETYRDEQVLRGWAPRWDLYGLHPPFAIRYEADRARVRAPWVEARAIRYGSAAQASGSRGSGGKRSRRRSAASITEAGVIPSMQARSSGQRFK